MLSIVVLGYNNFERYTQPCLDSLLPQLGTDEELLLVDNCSTDGSAESSVQYASARPRCRIIANQDNLGFAGGMNEGVRQTRGDWLLLVNNDTLFPRGSLARLRAVLADAPDDAGLLGPASNASGTGQQIGMADRPVEEIMQFGELLAQEPTGLLFDVYRVDFFCVAIRRTAWDQLGGLDTAFGKGYYEDFDFSLRIRDAGWRQFVTDDLLVAHIGSGSFRADRQAQNQLMKTNKKLLTAKHGDVRFEHQREGNLAILCQYRALFPKTSGAPARVRVRIETRLQQLRGSRPKGLIKRAIWCARAKSTIDHFRQVFNQPAEKARPRRRIR